MGPKIVFVGAGAVCGYAGAHMVQAGKDVTFINQWPEHVWRREPQPRYIRQSLPMARLRGTVCCGSTIGKSHAL